MDHAKDFLIKHQLLNPSQHWFLKAKSCLTNLLCFFEEITKWVDDGSPVDVIHRLRTANTRSYGKHLLLNPLIGRISVRLRVQASQQCVRDEHTHTRYSRSLVVGDSLRSAHR